MTDESKESKQEKLKAIIKDLHEGKPVEAVRKDFEKLVKNVSAGEISELEMALINEGIASEEVQRLCSVHVAVFEKSLKKQKKPDKIPGHPVHTYIHTYMLENKEAMKVIKRLKSSVHALAKEKAGEKVLSEFKNAFDELKHINYHYLRKENQLFPFLEKKGFTGPSKDQARRTGYRICMG